MKKIPTGAYTWIGMGVLITLLGLFYVSCSTNTYMGRWMKWRASDVNDYQKFPAFEFLPSPDPFHFIKSIDSNIGQLLIEHGKEKISLQQLVETSETTAFLVIRNDSLLYEQYASGYTRESINTSFSTAKSITGLLVGRAIGDGYITSENDPVTKYLPELKKVSYLYDSIRIAFLLDMRSGIQFRDHDLPWGDKPKAYYHPNLREWVMQLPVKDNPGEEFQYNSYNPILVGMVLEKATGMVPAAYFEKTIWNKLGMEFPGSWSADSETSMMTKMESGINLRAIDFAKFGRLVLNQGAWNDQQIIPADWVAKSIQIDPHHNVKEFGEEIYYENFWWLYSRDKFTPYIISGWGHLGQYLYIFPKKNMIVVRMGKGLGSVESWGKVFKVIAERDSVPLNFKK
ncbi:MAG TPA: serine hydrolase [Cyclobacteriaceae bacterium]|jgi:CubicO group peptidase (beta-lactamase class C family)|nr:serine hydrolase [Cytophagales bacterium]HMR55849.1 serine hydrolase [Cyclobacteriaceae bacterium]HRE66869.1 serine hydrolase [Cyclobacteriaceae bacterium]HRF34427.1 serine hydrolase [Cyclobacteriaceae bacterium]